MSATGCGRRDKGGIDRCVADFILFQRCVHVAWVSGDAGYALAGAVPRFGLVSNRVCTTNLCARILPSVRYLHHLSQGIVLRG